MKLRSIFACLVWSMRLAIDALASVTSSTKGETIRCFCNEASCVRTGYMCKSIIGTCYSVVMAADGGHGFRSTHGCADTLPETTRNVCESRSDEHAEKESASLYYSNQRLICCRQDMCNYIDGASIVLLSAIVNNGSPDKSSPADQERSSILNNDFERNQRDLWFRVAIIAVPLIGLFILILLVAAAVRMLRGDARRNHVVHSRDVMAVELCDRFVQNRNKTRSQDICNEFCWNHDYPICWVDVSDKNKNCCHSRTCKHQKYVLGSNCARIFPMENSYISIEKGVPLRGSLGKASAIRLSSQVHVPIATV